MRFSAAPPKSDSSKLCANATNRLAISATRHSRAELKSRSFYLRDTIVMDLSYGSQYEAFRLETRRFIEANSHLAPEGMELDRDRRRAWQKLLIENGLVARAIPKEYGGYGGEADILKSRIIVVECARAQISPGLGG